MLRKLIFLIILFIVLFCIGCVTNPITGQDQFMLISEEQEIEIGSKYAPEVEKQSGGRIPDPKLQNYINNIGQRLASVSHRPNLDYQFTAVNDKSVNAFALPGGFIFITKGMLSKLQTESQLAGILSHEITHVVARHSAEVMSQQIGINILLSSVTSEKTPNGVLTAVDMTHRILSLSYSREQERQADLGGLNYMVKAGYNPRGIVETMEILQRQNNIKQIEFFSTHPSHQNRIEYLIEQIGTYYQQTGNLLTGKEEYQKNVLELIN
jgi:predicted Zn-dependent protease